MCIELKIIKYGDGQAISIEKKAMEELNLEIGDILNIETRGREIILTKEDNLTFEE
ncbi:hypothetical protein [Salinicoccus sp. YB14-2]|uniref:AbrB/MazE/SpoVT family DNA-binding domain-containing protein n=1 Tax=Salinicoccus sp. YB14-2 TaxID=1572701 RepID=UPI000B2ECDAC|nr:hypothetical protein [Salinicoccus sp. YB14-2]